jgi:hypothetical protein
LRFLELLAEVAKDPAHQIQGDDDEDGDEKAEMHLRMVAAVVWRENNLHRCGVSILERGFPTGLEICGAENG